MAMVLTTSPIVLAQGSDQAIEPWAEFRGAVKQLIKEHSELHKSQYIPARDAAQDAQKALSEDKKNEEKKSALAVAIYNQMDLLLDVTKSRLEIGKYFATKIPVSQVQWLEGYSSALSVAKIEASLRQIENLEGELKALTDSTPLVDKLKELKVLRAKIIEFRVTNMLPVLGQLRSDRTQAGILKVEFLQENILGYLTNGPVDDLEDDELDVNTIPELVANTSISANSAWGKLRAAVISLNDAEKYRINALRLFNSIGGYTDGQMTQEARAAERGKYTDGNGILKEKSIPALTFARKLTSEAIKALRNLGSMCTTEYVPVCGEVQVQCVQAPCEPQQRTFGNKCELNKAGAKFLHEGECGKEPNTGGGIANPASVYCAEHEGTLEIRKGVNGEYGVCIFANGSECEEWAYYRGECGPSSKVCTTEYAPVCGEVQVQCIKAPCNPVQQTFSNECKLNKAGAKFVHEGVCIVDRPD